MKFKNNDGEISGNHVSLTKSPANCIIRHKIPMAHYTCLQGEVQGSSCPLATLSVHGELNIIFKKGALTNELKNKHDILK